MAGRAAATQSAAAFEFELLEDDPDHLRTVVAAPNLTSSWIEPSTVKLRHRVGRGPFGDVWLATQHLSTEDYDEYHEVAVKMLHPVKEEHMKAVLEKLDTLFCKCQGLKGVCWLNGISVISGKVSLFYMCSVSYVNILLPSSLTFHLPARLQICIIMKFYEGSIGDKMTLLKEGKLSLHDILR